MSEPQQIKAYFEGDLDAAAAERLALQLERSPQARRDFFELLDVEVALSRARNSSAKKPTALTRQQITAPTRRFSGRGLWAAAALILVVPVFGYVYLQGWPGRGQSAEVLLAAGALSVQQLSSRGKCSVQPDGLRYRLSSERSSACVLLVAGPARVALRLGADTRAFIEQSNRGVRVTLQQGRILMGVERVRPQSIVSAALGGLYVSFRGTAVELTHRTSARVRVLSGQVQVHAFSSSEESGRVLALPPGQAEEALRLLQAREKGAPDSRVDASAVPKPATVLEAGAGVQGSAGGGLEAVPVLSSGARAARQAVISAALAPTPHSKSLAAPFEHEKQSIRLRLQLRSGGVLEGFVRERAGRYEGLTLEGQRISVPVSQVRSVEVLAQ